MPKAPSKSIGSGASRQRKHRLVLAWDASSSRTPVGIPRDNSLGDGAHLFRKLGNTVASDLNDQTRVDLEVLVSEDVPQSHYRGPLDVAVLFFELLADMVRSLTDGNEVVFDGVDEYGLRDLVGFEE